MTRTVISSATRHVLIGGDLPFVVIDMVVASTVMSMGMVMLPPVVISLPFKILLFVLVDGWTRLLDGLFYSYL